MARLAESLRTELFADPNGKFVHDAILESCRQHAGKIAIIDTSCSPARRLTYGAYAELVERVARNLVASGVRPGEVIGIYLPNCWEFAVAFHAATLAGAIPTALNPTYREREVHYQLETADAVALITDGSLLTGIHLSGLPLLRDVYTIRAPGPGGTKPFDLLFKSTDTHLPEPVRDSGSMLATLPFSSGTTGLPKGVMLSHYNLVANVYQTLTIGEVGAISEDDVLLCFLPLYHIYGLTIGLNLTLMRGCTVVLMARFDCERSLQVTVNNGVTVTLCVPPALLAYCQAAEQDKFPRDHRLRWVKCGAAPLAPELARRFSTATGLPIRQGYGMTEASPVTHMGFLTTELYKPESAGGPVAQTECRVLDTNENEVAPGELGELVMRGPQIMQGYWKSPDATAAVLRDGWYWSGDIVRTDEAGEEFPCAFVVLRDTAIATPETEASLKEFVAERLTHYKMPREVHFVQSLPRTASGKILRRELRKLP